MKRFFLLPLRPAPLILVACFGVGLRIALLFGLIGIALAAILASWFFKYCFVLLDSAIAGEDEPPVLSIEMVNPLGEQRPLAVLILIALGYALAGLLEKIAGAPGLVLSSSLMLAALPASIAVLGLSDNPLQAASPVAVARLIGGLGRQYVWVALLTLAAGGGVYALVRVAAPLALTLPLAELAALYAFALIGGAVHENRLALGITTRTRAERRAERELQEHASARKRMLDDSFAQLRLGKTADAWREIERWIAAHGRGERAAEEYDALLDSTLQWEPPVVGDRLVSDYLARLLAERDNGRALEVLERRLASNPQYRPHEERHARRLRELAALAGKRALLRRLERQLHAPP